ncbi:hypothetical protein HYV12_00855 [Candidatus Dojkabacteria bacterium]|nr:hypothetical protein [Candidatus Dojkabacteria bacterium]
MIKLPNIEKSANLLVEISHNRIVTKLVYNDYSIGRHYVLTDILNPLPVDFTSSYIREYLKAVEKHFDWQFFRNSSDDQLMTFANEGFGVDAITVYLDSRYYDRKKYIEVIREVSKDISILTIDNTYIQDLLFSLANKLGYEDVVLLDLNLENTYMYRISRDMQRKTLNNPLGEGYIFKHGKIQLGNDWRVIDIATTANVRAFLQYETSQNRLSNMWSNYILGEKKTTSSNVIKDVIRSFNTLQCLTIRNDNKGDFDGIGTHKYSTLVIITGSIPTQLPYADLLLSTIDGLELGDACDIALDTSFAMYPLGRAHAHGIAKCGFLSEFSDFVSRLDQILVPDVAKSEGKKRAIFTAEVTDVKGERRNVYALSDEITQIMLDIDVDIQEIAGEFVKSSSIYSEFKYNLIISKKKYNSLLIDGRYRPIVYGPEPKNNHIKISQWLNASVN